MSIAHDKRKRQKQNDSYEKFIEKIDETWVGTGAFEDADRLVKEPDNVLKTSAK